MDPQVLVFRASERASGRVVVVKFSLRCERSVTIYVLLLLMSLLIWHEGMGGGFTLHGPQPVWPLRCSAAVVSREDIG